MARLIWTGSRAGFAESSINNHTKEIFMSEQSKCFAAIALVALAGAARADVAVQMNAVDDKGIGHSIGQVVISETPYGLVFTPALSGLPQGLHGFHVHENA
ncbi:MAG: hypothetical protein ACM3PQ_00040, partial [Methanosarcina sp.]